ncbi:nucleoside-diphosphate-sugar epimerase [Actinoplanes octamycinicus]|uniref:Nucleoside-diphosphate-sugar epimerase n=1 Tax=Actinoplanes octamycinicus TaxID=135948 RepID=A0A7W7H431_9ACTN|nr:NAD-dependent epimerase/dehydratase family protein [Actinoplanes octamycinicus]MBB4743630.1 nucleoside-diphosphate-sugar epimerase [Actinoplanes octamycinicus]GIE61055.1 nucleoside-diphosphate sugar epimerase [Actinoplanes octamycinicus]
MRIVVTGASGNIGTALLDRLAAHDEVSEIAGIARRVPPVDAGPPYDRVAWHRLDVAGSGAAAQLAAIFRGAAAVVHLAWHIVGGHDRRAQARTNRVGSTAVLAAAIQAGVPQLVHLSSAAVYSPRTGDVVVPESWPRRGCERSAYSRDKVAVEDLLDRVEAERPGLRIARIRPPAVLQPAAAGDLARLALGRVAPLARPVGARALVLPLPAGATMQVAAAPDVADLVTRAVLARAAGPFNVADPPVLTARVLARLLGGRHLPAPRPVVRGLLGAAWALGLQPLDASWADLLLDTPLLDCSRAEAVLGWRPRHDARLTVLATRRAIAGGVGTASPRLRPAGR